MENEHNNEHVEHEHHSEDSSPQPESAEVSESHGDMGEGFQSQDNQPMGGFPPPQPPPPPPAPPPPAPPPPPPGASGFPQSPAGNPPSYGGQPTGGFPPPHGRPGGYAPPPGFQYPQQTSYPGKGLSIAALVLGICSLVFPGLGIVTAIIALVLGILGKKKADEAGAPTGMATAGVVMSIIAIAFSVLTVVVCVACFAAAINYADTWWDPNIWWYWH